MIYGSLLHDDHPNQTEMILYLFSWFYIQCKIIVIFMIYIPDRHVLISNRHLFPGAQNDEITTPTFSIDIHVMSFCFSSVFPVGMATGLFISVVLFSCRYLAGLTGQTVKRQFYVTVPQWGLCIPLSLRDDKATFAHWAMAIDSKNEINRALGHLCAHIG